MKKHKSKTLSPTLRPIDDLLHKVVGGSSMANMLAGAIAGGVAGAAGGDDVPRLKPFPGDDDVIPLKPFPR